MKSIQRTKVEMSFQIFKVFIIMFCMLYGYPKLLAQDNTWFVDVGHQLGFNVLHADGVTAVDVNNDNYPDLVTHYLYQLDTGWHLFINQQDPANPNDPKARIYVDATQGSGINTPGLMRDFSAFADYNNDGNVDMVTIPWFQDSSVNNNVCLVASENGSRLHLFLGDGHGHFTLKTNSNLEALGYHTGGALLSFDYNKDGNLDLYVGNHYHNWCYGVPAKSYLLKGNGDGTFTDVTASSGVWYDPQPIFGGNIADWNDDCNQDILTAPYLAAGYANLFKNNGNGTFTDVGVAANYNPHFTAGDNGQAMVPWAAMPCDYDNDGDLDFMVLEVHGGTSSTEGRTTVFTNGGSANGYKLTPNLSQIVRGNPQNSHHGDHCGFWSDFDNDGWADLAMGDAVYASSPQTDGQRMFLCLQNSTTHVFNDITKDLGFIGNGLATSISDRIRHPGVMIPCDYDMDGDEDIIKVPYDGGDSVNFLVLRNDIANKNHYIKIKLESSAGINKDCIGAKVRVKSGNVWQMREVYGNQGHWSNQYAFILNFGIGNNTEIDSIDVRWPDASCSHTAVTHVAADQFISINKHGLSVADAQPVEQKFMVYPNPTTNELTIHVGNAVTNGKENVIIRNIQGRIMTQVMLQHGDKTISIASWPAGTYLVQCYDGEKYNTVKIIKVN